jgi:hypothetical protein
MAQGIWYRDSETDEWEIHYRGEGLGVAENRIDEFGSQSIPALVELLRSQTLWPYRTIEGQVEKKLRELDKEDKLR